MMKKGEGLRPIYQGRTLINGNVLTRLKTYRFDSEKPIGLILT